MLLNKFSFLILILISLSIFSCADKKEKKDVILDFDDPKQLLSVAQTHFDKDIKKVFVGEFEDKKTKSVVAVAEKLEDSDWGIKFYHLVQDKNQVVCKFESKILPGDLASGTLDKIKFPNTSYELIYYNSLDYFLGTAGGEIYMYLIDFNLNEIYYSHFVNDYDTPASLYISENTKDLKFRNFFVTNLKKDYPNLKVVDKDISLD
ncbi:MAG: hypothetical protein N2043_12350 [Ignavibacterium sp.]|nr:hypothetical protein [Ignavibacterium sp.]